MFKKIVLAVALASTMVGCTRIETGTVGLRVDASKQIQGNELVPGSWNQTLIGSVLEFPVRDIGLSIDNKSPLTADNSALSDFDVSVVYSINPSSVSDLYSNKSKSFHASSDEGVFLMYNYVSQLVNNASYKVVRQYKSLELADKREVLETEIKSIVEEKLKEQKLDNAITITAVQVRNVKPNAAILESATRFVEAQNALRVKQTEVDIATKEAERLRILAATADDAIKFKNAEAQNTIAQAILEGKVNTIIVPADFKGMVNVGGR